MSSHSRTPVLCVLALVALVCAALASAVQPRIGPLRQADHQVVLPAATDSEFDAEPSPEASAEASAEVTAEATPDATTEASVVEATASVGPTATTTTTTTTTTDVDVDVDASATPTATTSAVDVEASAEPSTSPEEDDATAQATDDADSDTETEAAPVQSAPEPVCIHAAHLAHVPRGRLVFGAHRAASVLCDARGSCATPGHVVTLHGAAMMMRTYCALKHSGGCRVVHGAPVNSPRFERRWRAPSNTDGLLFTALAARYESRAEQLLLAAAVHAGL